MPFHGGRFPWQPKLHVYLNQYILQYSFRCGMYSLIYTFHRPLAGEMPLFNVHLNIYTHCCFCTNILPSTAAGSPISTYFLCTPKYIHPYFPWIFNHTMYSLICTCYVAIMPYWMYSLMCTFHCLLCRGICDPSVYTLIYTHHFRGHLFTPCIP